ncbi:MAG TPA: TfoX/Sxy family protein [Candidatus Saccharimonadia bacterium]|nr:TfoX/Sxy family protein [Candidatus Saccharimonadia bacterium]
MKMTPPDPATKDWFRDLCESYPQLVVRPMFGHLAAFGADNGQMTAGVYGTEVNLRLSEADRAELMATYDAKLFEPLPGRPMREYVVVPEEVQADEKLLEHWLQRAIDYTSGLPPKKR